MDGWMDRLICLDAHWRTHTIYAAEWRHVSSTGLQFSSFYLITFVVSVLFILQHSWSRPNHEAINKKQLTTVGEWMQSMGQCWAHGEDELELELEIFIIHKEACFDHGRERERDFIFVFSLFLTMIYETNI